jgi:hypothetical protein
MELVLTTAGLPGQLRYLPRPRWLVLVLAVAAAARCAIGSSSTEPVLEYAERVAATPPSPNVNAHPYNAIRKMACNFGWDWPGRRTR